MFDDPRSEVLRNTNTENCNAVRNDVNKSFIYFLTIDNLGVPDSDVKRDDLFSSMSLNGNMVLATSP